jgi:hypothetical protein
MARETRKQDGIILWEFGPFAVRKQQPDDEQVPNETATPVKNIEEQGNQVKSFDEQVKYLFT